MILDGNLLFDGSVSANGVLSGSNISTTAGSTQVSANILDLLNARDIGEAPDGTPPRLLVLVSTAFASTGAGTLQALFQGSTDSVTWETYAESPVFASGQLVANAELMNITVPSVVPQTGPAPRYLRMAYAVGTAPFTPGAVISAIVLGKDPARYYPPGVVVNN